MYLMNNDFNKFLYNFVLVFLDDTKIESKLEEECEE